MSHFLDDRFQADLALVVKLQHGHYTVLHQRPARRSFEIGAVLLFLRVWRVVCGYHIDTIVQQGFEDLLLVCGGLYGGVPLDAGAQALIIRVVEPEMVYAGFGRDLFLRQRYGVIEQRGFPACRDVEYMQACTVLFGEPRSERR